MNLDKCRERLTLQTTLGVSPNRTLYSTPSAMVDPSALGIQEPPLGSSLEGEVKKM